MPGPSKQFDHDEVLGRAIETFWTYGYDGTNFERLVQTMGISRSSLYATFGDKHSLYLAAIRRYGELQMTRLREALIEGRGSPMTRLARGMRLFEEMCSQPAHAGCLLVNTMTELGIDGPIGEVLTALRERAIGAIQHVLDDAVAAGELAQGIDTRGLARLSMTFLHGLAVSAKAGVPRAELRRELETLQRMIQGQS